MARLMGIFWCYSIHKVLILAQFINTKPKTQGRVSNQPFSTLIPASTIQTINEFNPSSELPNSLILEGKSDINAFIARNSMFDRMGSTNVFLPVATGPPPQQIPSRGDHPVPRLGIVSSNGASLLHII